MHKQGMSQSHAGPCLQAGWRRQRPGGLQCPALAVAYQLVHRAPAYQETRRPSSLRTGPAAALAAELELKVKSSHASATKQHVSQSENAWTYVVLSESYGGLKFSWRNREAGAEGSKSADKRQQLAGCVMRFAALCGALLRDLDGESARSLTRVASHVVSFGATLS